MNDRCGTYKEDNVRDVLMQEVFKQRSARQQQKGISNVELARLLGCFLQVSLNRLGYKPDNQAKYLAKCLNTEAELADALLNGFLPISQIGDDLLIDLAKAVQYEANILRLILRRDIEPSHDSAVREHVAPSSSNDTSCNNNEGAEPSKPEANSHIVSVLLGAEDEIIIHIEKNQHMYPEIYV